MIENEEAALLQLYQQNFLKAAALVRKLGGDLEMAKDLFHDAMIVYMERRTTNSLPIKTSPEAYLLGIVKILWIKKWGNERRHVQVDELEKGISIPDELYSEEEEEKRMIDRLKAVAQKCMQLLTAFYYDGLSMQDLAKRFGFNGIRSATVQKHKCLEKVRGEVKKMQAYEAGVN